MTETPSSFFVAGGTLRHDASSYVERQADRDLLAELLKSEFCYVLTSRQMGKSSLMVRTAHKLREQQVNVVALDLTAVGQNLTPEQWYDGLLARMGRQLRLEDEIDDFWDHRSKIGPAQRFFSALQEVVLPARPGPVCIFVDELDVVRSLSFSTDEFFAGIRECYTRRTIESELCRVTFCLLGVATPNTLIRDTRITPFNIGRRIDLNDFTPAEAAPLAQGFSSADRSQPAFERVMYWSRGHPYLTQRLCRTAVERQVSSPAEVDQACADLFLSAAARDRDDNLIFVRENLLRAEVDRTALLDLYARVHRGRRVLWDEANPLLPVLRLAGVIRVHDGSVVTRNRIYGTVFDQRWIRRHRPGAEVRRQRRAFRRGLITAVGIAAGLVFAAVLWRWQLDRPPKLAAAIPAIPATNAFYLYQTAGRLLTASNQLQILLSLEPEQRSTQALEEVLRLNANSLSLIRMGFSYPCRFPPARWSQISEDYSAIGNLSALLRLEGELHEARSEWPEAARSYLDVMILGADRSRGTPLIGRLFSRGDIARGTFRIARLLRHLDAVTSRRLVHNLQSIVDSETSFRDTLAEEKRDAQAEILDFFQRPNWRAEAFGLTNDANPEDQVPFLSWFYQQDQLTTPWQTFQRFAPMWVYTWTRSKRAIMREQNLFYDRWLEFARDPVPRLNARLPPGPDDPFLRRSLDSTTLLRSWIGQAQITAQVRILQSAAAVHAFQLDRGRLPDGLGELVPAYLLRIPADPFFPTDSLKYRPAGPILLYSVGPDGKDDAGRTLADFANGWIGDVALTNRARPSQAAPPPPSARAP